MEDLPGLGGPKIPEMATPCQAKNRVAPYSYTIYEVLLSRQNWARPSLRLVRTATQAACTTPRGTATSPCGACPSSVLPAATRYSLDRGPPNYHCGP